jgi:hypothetical protein
LSLGFAKGEVSLEALLFQLDIMSDWDRISSDPIHSIELSSIAISMTNKVIIKSEDVVFIGLLPLPPSLAPAPLLPRVLVPVVERLLFWLAFLELLLEVLLLEGEDVMLAGGRDVLVAQKEHLIV